MKVTETVTYNDADLQALLDGGGLAEYADVLAESMVIYGPLLDRALVEYADHLVAGRQ